MIYDHLQRRNHYQYEDFTLAGAIKNYAPDLKLEPVSTELHLTVDLHNRSASGFALITIQANVNGGDSLNLDAVDFDDLKVSDNAGLDLNYSYDGKIISLHFAQPFNTGDEQVIRIEYSIQDPISGMQFSQPDAQRPEFPLYAITDNETERARYWFPCVDFPTVRSKMEYHLTAAEDLTILANGELISEKTKNGMKTAHWKLDYPCPSYLACFTIGEFSEYYDEPLRDIPIAYFADKSYTPEQLKRTYEPTRRM